MTKVELIEKAEGLGIQVPTEATKAEIEALIAQSESESSTEDVTTVKVGNDTYEFGVKSFRFKGVHYTAEEAAKDTDLIKDLVKAKYPQLKKL